MLQKQEQEVVRFNDFSSAVTSCFLFKGTQIFVDAFSVYSLLTMTANTFDCVFSILCTDFILQAKSLFQELDLSGRGTMSCLLVKTTELYSTLSFCIPNSSV